MKKEDKLLIKRIEKKINRIELIIALDNLLTRNRRLNNVAEKQSSRLYHRREQLATIIPRRYVDAMSRRSWTYIKDEETKSTYGYDRVSKERGHSRWHVSWARGWKSLSPFRSRRHAEMDPDQNASVCFFRYR